MFTKILLLSFLMLGIATVSNAGVLLVEVWDAMEPLGNNPEVDPYVKITAHSRDGSSVTRTTNKATDNNQPMWDEELDFGDGDWFSLDYVVLDGQGPSEQDLTETHSVNLMQYGDLIDDHELFMIYYITN